ALRACSTARRRCRRTCEGRFARRGSAARRAHSVHAALSGGARAALEDPGAAVADGAALDPLRRAGEGQAGRDAALARLATAAANQAVGTGPAVDEAADAVAGRPALDALLRAGLRLSLAAPGVRRAGAAVEHVAAPVGGHPAGRALLCAAHGVALASDAG